MNPFQIQRDKSGWAGGLVEWREGQTACLSISFSWLLPDAWKRARQLRAQGWRVCAGGPAVALNPGFLADVAQVGGEIPALARHNPNATRTTRGCPNRCAFCAVPRVEGDLVELRDWTPRPLVCDNNLLAASKKHFDLVIDRLKTVVGVDFNQGLDARLLTAYHAGRLAELNLTAIRLAWDSVAIEPPFMQAVETLRRAGIPKRSIRVYVLIGFGDTPGDALYRLNTVRALGLIPNPMRYQPLDTLKRNQFVAPGWTGTELSKMVRYFSNLRRVGGIPYDEFMTNYRSSARTASMAARATLGEGTGTLAIWDDAGLPRKAGRGWPGQSDPAPAQTAMAAANGADGEATR